MGIRGSVRCVRFLTEARWENVLKVAAVKAAVLKALKAGRFDRNAESQQNTGTLLWHYARGKTEVPVLPPEAEKWQ